MDLSIDKRMSGFPVAALWPVRFALACWHFVRRWPVIPGVILATLVICAIFASQVAPHSFRATDLRQRNAPPIWMEGGTSARILGGDVVGRDILSRLIHGARVEMMVATISLFGGAILGTIIGLVAGYYGGVVDEVLMRLVDIWFSIPFLLFALVVAIAFTPSLQVVLILLAILAWSVFVRNIRAEVLVIKTTDYVSSARVAGASTLRLMVRHFFPGIVNTMMVIASLRVGQLILAESSLSFLGAGIPAPTPAWGVMVADGRNYLDVAWWVSTLPGVAILLTVMSFNFLGDWLRDRLDPRLRQI